MRAARLPNLNDLVAFARHFEFRTVSRWVGFCFIVGVASGLFAAAFYFLTDCVRHVFFDLGARLPMPEPHGEASLFEGAIDGPTRYWLLPLGPAVGGFIAGWLVHRFCPEAGGGTDGYIKAFHREQGGMKRRLPWVKLLASSVFLGTGASAGREGAIAHIGSGLGAHLGRLLKLSDREQRLLLVAGAAGGIGAIFRSPLGGALFAVEVLYRDDLEVDALVPAVLSSVVAYSVFTMIFGEGSMFAVASSYPFDPRQLPLYLLMAIGAALIGVAFVVLHRRLSRLLRRLALWPPLKPMLCGLLAGLLGLLVPQTFGTGYGWLQEALLPSGPASIGTLGVAMLLLIVVGKVLATALIRAGGGPGGAFGPTVVIGGLVGGAFGITFHQWFPTVVPEPSAFIIVGMACFVGGVTHAPISTLVMASEMTGSYDLLVPTMLAEVVTFALMRRWTLFSVQVPTRRDSPAHGGEYVLDVLQDIRVGEVMRLDQTVQSVAASVPLAQLLRDASESTQAVFPVTDATGKIQGIVSLESLRAFFYNDELGRLAIAADCAMPFTALDADDSLATALERFAASHYQQLPVVQRSEPTGAGVASQGSDAGDLTSRDVVALLSYEDLLHAYSRELIRRRSNPRSVSTSSVPPSQL